MTPGKRAFDVIVALALGVVCLPVIAGVAVMILLRDGRPVLYVSERMKSPTEAFGMLKFRSMTVATGERDVTGGARATRITGIGKTMRGRRIDELPQLWNVLRGDMSLVGPRPPLRDHVERFPDLYGRVLRCRPGITGLATVRFRSHEDRLLARTTTTEDADRVYCRACVPRKARLDLIYQARRSLCFDLSILWETAFRWR